MTKLEIMELENELVTEAQFEEIELSQYVAEVQDCGRSGQHPNWNWYNVVFTDGDEASIYMHFE